MKLIHTVLGAVIGSVSAALSVSAEPMSFEGVCFGNHTESCFIVAQGEITVTAPLAPPA